jgi:hypothetical protein
MLKFAGLYLDELNKKMNEISFKERYKYVVNSAGYVKPIEINKDTNFQQYVEINDKNELTGYLEVFVDYMNKTFFIDFAVSFIEENNYEFIKDIYKLVEMYFINNKDIAKIQWGATTSNPIKKSYDKIYKRFDKNPKYHCQYNIFYMCFRTYDGKLLDQCNYQIIKINDYFNRDGFED